MIQVIGRVASIMEKLAADDLPLAQLSGNGALNHGTLCNILRSLIEIGWVEKKDRGKYRLSAAFRELGNAAQWPEELCHFLHQETNELSRKIRESVVLSTLCYNRVVILSQASYQHTLMINGERLYARMSLYTSVSGEVLCAGLLPEQRHALYRFQPPTKADLQDNADIAGYEAKLAAIRQQGLHISINEKYGIKSWALPIHDQQGAICACLGLSIPLVRLPEDQGEKIQVELYATRDRIARWIAKNGYSSKDFLRIPMSLPQNKNLISSLP